MKKALIAFILAAAMLVLCSCMTTDNDDDLNITPLPTADTYTSRPTLEPTATPTPDTTDSGDIIENFMVGTIVDISAVPEIAKAITDKFEDATITGITHAMHLDKQVYEVRYTTKDGVTHTAYVSPDGKTVTDATEPEASASQTAD